MLVNLCLPMLILSLYRPSVGVRKDWWSWFVAYLQLLSSRHHLLFAGPPRLYHKITGYGSTWVAWDTWTTLKVRALSCLWFFTAHPVSQSMDDLHLSSLSLRSYRSDLVFGCSFVCAASSHYVATGHFSPDVSLRQQRRWCRSRWPRRPRQCPPRHHLPLSTTRQCSYSPRRAGNTVPHKSLVSQTPQCTVRSMSLFMASPL